MCKSDVTKLGGLNYFWDGNLNKLRTVFILPGVMIPVKVKNRALIDFTSAMFGIQANVTENSIEHS